MMRFSPQTLTIQAQGEQSGRCEVQIEAMVTTDGLLAYHQVPTEAITTGKNGGLRVCRSETKKWAVTHVPSGRYITQVEGEESSVKALIQTLFDLIKRDKGLMPTVDQVMNAYQQFCSPLAQLELFEDEQKEKKEK